MAAIEGGLPALTAADVEALGFLIKRMRRWNQTGKRSAIKHSLKALAELAACEYFGFEPDSTLSPGDARRLDSMVAAIADAWVAGRGYFGPGGGAA